MWCQAAVQSRCACGEAPAQKASSAGDNLSNRHKHHYCRYPSALYLTLRNFDSPVVHSVVIQTSALALKIHFLYSRLRAHLSSKTFKTTVRQLGSQKSKSVCFPGFDCLIIPGHPCNLCQTQLIICTIQVLVVLKMAVGFNALMFVKSLKMQN